MTQLDMFTDDDDDAPLSACAGCGQPIARAADRQWWHRVTCPNSSGYLLIVCDCAEQYHAACLPGANGEELPAPGPLLLRMGLVPA